ncbi:MAG: flagellar protein FlaG [Proteobacteria bacterium]|nr:flagellar protein FlaG [Pseudomonadota bacterium]MBU1611210.1 flagellar protein FlaG [Pseudomonadota bacterium]
MMIHENTTETAAAPARVEAVRAGQANTSRQSEDKVPKRETLPASADGKKLDRQTVETIVQKAQEQLSAKGVALTFNIQEDNESIQVEVRDAKSGKVIRKIPDDEMLKLSESIKDMAGVLMDKPA